MLKKLKKDILLGGVPVTAAHLLCVNDSSGSFVTRSLVRREMLRTVIKYPLIFTGTSLIEGLILPEGSSYKRKIVTRVFTVGATSFVYSIAIGTPWYFVLYKSVMDGVLAGIIYCIMNYDDALESKIAWLTENLNGWYKNSSLFRLIVDLLRLFRSSILD